jgi:PadR family transcriptional regulator, regulatory protein PadR
MSRPRRDEMPALFLTPMEEDVLTLLNGRKLYSVQIERALKEVCDRKQRAGSIYPSLRDMEKRGLIYAEWGDEPSEARGGPRRRYFTTTGLGKKALSEAATRRDRLASWTLAVDND